MLIGREDAILKCQERLYESALNNVGIECKADEVFYDIAQNRIRDWLKELPSAERVGKWVNHRNDDGHNIADCNLCGSTLQWFDNDGEHNYCPNCGARTVSEDDT